MAPKKRASGRHHPGERTRANGYTGKSNWNSQTAQDIREKHAKEDAEAENARKAARRDCVARRCKDVSSAMTKEGATLNIVDSDTKDLPSESSQSSSDYENNQGSKLGGSLFAMSAMFFRFQRELVFAPVTSSWTLSRTTCVCVLVRYGSVGSFLNIAIALPPSSVQEALALMV
jgi:hypothetical protein